MALRMAIKKSEYKVHFDYFSVDFDEEHSAFYGAVLDGQVLAIGLTFSTCAAGGICLCCHLEDPLPLQG